MQERLKIFNLYLAGETVDKISKMMQAENYDIPGKTISFSKGMIMNMLSNERYCGDAILQKSVTIDCIEKKRKKNTGEAPMYYVQNNHPAVIDRVTFNKVQEALESPTIVVITDRNDLDDQLYGQFARCKDFLRQTPQHAESRKNLKELLANRQANGIIFTTMQKFEESNEALSERRNIMNDLLHRRYSRQCERDRYFCPTL